MKITDVPFAVLRFQYQLARIPLQLIEEQLAARLDEEAPGRLFYERSLGTLDATVGTLLSDPELRKRGNALIERSDTLRAAADLEAKAAAKEAEADTKLKAERDKAIREQQEARETRQDKVEKAKKTATQRKQSAAETAQKRTAAVKKQADELAAKRVESAEAEKRAEQALITDLEQQVAADADAKREDAQEKRSDAATMRAQADHVEQLADAEKQSRKSSP
jgi:hypothetical protein